MKNTHSILILIILLAIGSFFCFSVVLAGDTTSLAGGLDKAAKMSGLAVEGADTPTLEYIIGKYVGMAVSFLGIIFMIVVLYGGITWLTSGGNPENVTKARNTLIHGAIGLLVTLMAYQVTHYVIEKIGTTVN